MTNLESRPGQNPVKQPIPEPLTPEQQIRRAEARQIINGINHLLITDTGRTIRRGNETPFTTVQHRRRALTKEEQQGLEDLNRQYQEITGFDARIKNQQAGWIIERDEIENWRLYGSGAPIPFELYSFDSRLAEMERETVDRYARTGIRQTEVIPLPQVLDLVAFL